MKCPHHGFSELHQLDTFYNVLNPNDQDALNSAAGGNFLDKIPRESSLEDKLDIRMSRFEKSLNDIKASFVTPTVPIKAVEERIDPLLVLKESPKTFLSKWGEFHFPANFVVVDFEADPRVPLNLGRSFLRTDRALIDVYGEEITLRVNDEAVTFNLNQTTRYSSTYDDIGNPTSTSEPIIFDSSPSLTPFEGSDFISEEIEAYLKDESISPENDHADCDLEGDICLIEKLLNDDLFQFPPMDLKQGEVVKAKSSIKEPPDLELKDLPSHLEYAYKEGVDKLLVIIAKRFKSG
uniref:Reverse transcriptase domain-containing protein n=1 Tax=Tanacetum cinerariifolium TaxID=118510 RepID=A0A699HRL6_TANCI|nr:reverse transcriptase domain-containing protein [Tanacetum cinerariifolium]